MRHHIHRVIHLPSRLLVTPDGPLGSVQTLGTSHDAAVTILTHAGWWTHHTFLLGLYLITRRGIAGSTLCHVPFQRTWVSTCSHRQVGTGACPAISPALQEAWRSQGSCPGRVWWFQLMYLWRQMNWSVFRMLIQLHIPFYKVLREFVFISTDLSSLLWFVVVLHIFRMSFHQIHICIASIFPCSVVFHFTHFLVPLGRKFLIRM